MEENNNKPIPNPERKPTPRRDSPSFFGPVVLIAGGSYFLLNNLGYLPDLNWAAATRLWPLLLIFGGLNMILRQVRRPLGGILSLLVALLAAATFGYVLLGPVLPETLQPLATAGIVNSQLIEFDTDAAAADIDIDFNAAGADLYALRDSDSFVEAEISYLNELEIDWNEGDSDYASLQIDTVDRSASVLSAATGLIFGPEDVWQIGLSPDALLTMKLDLSSGQAYLDLSELQLERLTVDGGSGQSTLLLPSGDYEVDYDIGSGRTTIQVGSTGMQNIVLDGGSGQLVLLVPAGVPVRLEVEDGSGRLDLDDRFEQISQDGDRTVWQTRGFAADAPHANIYLDLGSGSVSSELP